MVEAKIAGGMSAAPPIPKAAAEDPLAVLTKAVKAAPRRNGQAA
ncbi:MAG TPA: hypothetical protein VFG00_10885 [Acidothermaceae bacterium]|nr:hypothetical protein [Acidothermaceae bacterium]